MLAIHAADQAEARRLDGKPPAEPVIEPDPKSEPALACPECGKAYKLPGALQDHIRREHKREP